MPTESHTEFRVRRVPHDDPDHENTWMGPSRSREDMARVAKADTSRPNMGATFVVERRTVTVTTTEWVESRA